jgi:hypothetical protein
VCSDRLAFLTRSVGCYCHYNRNLHGSLAASLFRFKMFQSKCLGVGEVWFWLLDLEVVIVSQAGLQLSGNKSVGGRAIPGKVMCQPGQGLCGNAEGLVLLDWLFMFVGSSESKESHRPQGRKGPEHPMDELSDAICAVLGLC